MNANTGRAKVNTTHSSYCFVFKTSPNYWEIKSIRITFVRLETARLSYLLKNKNKNKNQQKREFI